MQIVGEGPLLAPPAPLSCLRWSRSGESSGAQEGTWLSAGVQHHDLALQPAEPGLAWENGLLNSTQRTTSSRDNSFSPKGSCILSVTAGGPLSPSAWCSGPGAGHQLLFILSQGTQRRRPPATLSEDWHGPGRSHEKLLTWTDTVGLFVNEPVRWGVGRTCGDHQGSSEPRAMLICFERSFSDTQTRRQLHLWRAASQKRRPQSEG